VQLRRIRAFATTYESFYARARGYKIRGLLSKRSSPDDDDYTGPKAGDNCSVLLPDLLVVRNSDPAFARNELQPH
jgi:hypothetical protein